MGWMEGYMDGWMGGWLGWMDGRTDKSTPCLRARAAAVRGRAALQNGWPTLSVYSVCLLICSPYRLTACVDISTSNTPLCFELKY